MRTTSLMADPYSLAESLLPDAQREVIQRVHKSDAETSSDILPIILTRPLIA